MGQEEVELARRAYAAFNRGDLAGALQAMDPAIEWHMSDQFTRTSRVFHGHQGVREVYELFTETLDDFRADPHDVYDGGDRIIAPVHVTGKVRGTGDEAAYELVQVWTIRDHQAVRLDVYATLEDAWEATEITPPPASSDSISEAGTGLENR